MRQYELMVIFDPETDERAVQPLFDKFLTVVTKDGGTVDNLDIWGRRRLAYDIKKKSEGIYIVGDKSWSIDMQRHNFQFTGQRFHRIRGGKLAGQVRDVAYQATTTDFWGSLEAVGGRSTWRRPGIRASSASGCSGA